MIAAMMTAANLGARVTGWGFAVFTLGSICWTIVGFTSGQPNLIIANAFLTLVNLAGIWRWLGRQRAHEDGARSAAVASRKSTVPTLFPATGMAGMPVVAADGTALGKAIEALIECQSGAVSYAVVATSTIGGLEEVLRPVPATVIAFGCDLLTLTISQAEFERIEPLTSDDWPASAELTMGKLSA
nr:PRC-barrel domain-containing protein [Novosphingobium sp. PhB165]